MNVLVDSSVWVSHFKVVNANLVALLERDLVLVHPLIIGELACGTPPARTQTLFDLRGLRQTQQANIEEVANWIEREQLYGLGCGIVDMMLLASVLLTPNCRLWTLDKRLLTLAERFDIVYQPESH